MLWKSTVEAIHAWTIDGGYKENMKPLHMIFSDLKKPYINVPR